MTARRRRPDGQGRGTTGLRIAAVVVLGALLLWAPYPRGLYHGSVQIPALWNAVLALALALGLGLAERRRLVFTPVRVAAVILWSAYVLSLTVAATPRGAIQEIIKQSIFLAVLLAISELATPAVPSAGEATAQTTPAWARALRGLLAGRPEGLALLLWSGVVLLGLASLLGAVGLLPFQAVMAGRLYTYLGYPNSAGALAGAALLLGLGLRNARTGSGSGARSFLGDAALAAGQWVAATVVILTMSRGAWLVLPVAVLATVVLWPSGRRWAVLGDFAATGLAAVAVAPFIPGAFGVPGRGLALAALGLVLAIAAGWVARRYQRLGGRAQAAVAVSVLLAAVVLAFGLLRFGLLPPTLADRLAGFSLSERSAAERIAWTADALKIVKDHPVLGVGGGGWSKVYFEYQSYGYATTEVHNDFVQIWAETGTIGFLAWLGLVGAVAWAAIGARRRLDSGGAALAAAIAGAAAVIVLHAAVDFDLAVGAMGVYLWAFFGLLDGLGLEPVAQPAAPQGRPASRRAAGTGAASPGLRLAVLAVGVVVSLVAGSLYAAQAIAGRATDQASSLNGLERYQSLNRAVALDPWSTVNRMNLALISEKIYQAFKEKPYILEARQEAEKAVALEEENPNTHAFLSSFISRYGEYAIAERESEEALRLQPFEAQRYVDVAHIHVIAGIDQLEAGKTEEAQAEFEVSLGVVDAVAEQSAKVPAWVPAQSGLPALPSGVALYSGQAALLLGDADRAAELFTVAHESGRVRGFRETEAEVAKRQAQAALWLSVLEQSQGHAAAAAAYLSEAKAALPDAGQTIQTLVSYIGTI